MKSRLAPTLDAETSHFDGNYLTQAKEVVGEVLHFLLGPPSDQPMTRTKTLLSMPLRDPNFEFVKARSRKEKEKDRDKDKDNRSTVSGLAIRRHRDSNSTKHGSTTDTLSQVSTEIPNNSGLDQLPPLPESASTSPILRTTSHVSLGSRTSPSQIQTPANLQPYLESDSGETESNVGDSQSALNLGNSAEWIGPIPEESSEASTPRASMQFSSRRSGQQRTATGPIRENPANQPKIRPRSRSTTCPSPDLSFDSFPPSEMDNPFLNTQLTTNSSSLSSPTLTKSTAYVQDLPQDSSSSQDIWRIPSSQQTASVASTAIGSRSETSRSTPPYIAGSQLTTLSRGNAVASAESPFMLIQRVTSAMPDVYALVRRYQDCVHSLERTENQVRELEAQKRHLDEVSEQIESYLETKKAEVSSMSKRIEDLEGKNRELRKRVNRETSQKEEIMALYEKLRKDYKQAENRHAEEREGLLRSHMDDKNRLESEHEESRQAWTEHTQAQAQIADADFSARVAEAHRNFEAERQGSESRWAREKRELEFKHLKAREDLESSISSKSKLIEDEQQNNARMMQSWESEKANLRAKHQEIKEQHQEELKKSSEHFIQKAHQDKEDAMKSLESTHQAQRNQDHRSMKELERTVEKQIRQKNDALDATHDLQKQADIDKRSLADSQETIEKLTKENTEFRSLVERLRSQRREESEERHSRRNAEKERPSPPREDSRQRPGPPEPSKLRTDTVSGRARAEEARDTINDLRRDPEPTRSQQHSERRLFSRTDPENRNSVRLTGNESMLAQKSSDIPTSKGKRVSWQQW